MIVTWNLDAPHAFTHLRINAKDEKSPDNTGSDNVTVPPDPIRIDFQVQGPVGTTFRVTFDNPQSSVSKSGIIFESGLSAVQFVNL